MKYRIHFKGTVLLNGQLALHTWEKEVIASSMEEANHLFKEKFKKEYELEGKHRVSLYGKFRIIEKIME